MSERQLHLRTASLTESQLRLLQDAFPAAPAIEAAPGKEDVDTLAAIIEIILAYRVAFPEQNKQLTEKRPGWRPETTSLKEFEQAAQEGVFNYEIPDNELEVILQALGLNVKIARVEDIIFQAPAK